MLLARMLLLAIWIASSGCSPKEPLAKLAPQRYIFGLSPFLADGSKDEVFRQIVSFVIEDAPLGSSVWICDAFHNKTVAKIDIPIAGAFASPKTRASQFKEPIGRLKEFLATSHPEPQRDGLYASSAAASVHDLCC